VTIGFVHWSCLLGCSVPEELAFCDDAFAVGAVAVGAVAVGAVVTGTVAVAAVALWGCRR